MNEHNEQAGEVYRHRYPRLRMLLSCRRGEVGCKLLLIGSLATSLLRGILLVAGIMLLIACGKPGQSDDPTAEYEALKTDVPPGTAKMEQFYLGAGFTVSHSDSSRVTYRFIEGKKRDRKSVV